MTTSLIEFETPYGAFTMSLFSDKAPLTCAYFLAHAAQGFFDGASFFRIVGTDNASLRSATPIEVVQGGLQESDTQKISPIAHESTRQTGLTHKKWTVSTARFDPGETYGSFFICMRDEFSLDFGGARHPDGLGFAAFGEISAGFDVVNKVFSAREAGEILESPVPIIHCKVI